jgi:RNA polymerase sigma-70 factor (ECF subfamily)
MEALDRLSSEHRDVLVEIYYRGHTVAEAARRLGIPEGTAKSRAHYALKAMRGLYTKKPGKAVRLQEVAA